jgi:CRISPR-associated protein Cst2
MTIHVFGNIITALGTAANNRGLTEGNTTTLQKLVWAGQVHTTVSAEAIRFALRRHFETIEKTNRRYDEAQRTHSWADNEFKAWGKDTAKGEPFIDDDVLGFMIAEGAKQETKGGAKVRRAVLEISRAVSLTAWTGDVTFNAASPGATPSAQKKGDSNPVPYGTEVHATRYQYGFAFTPSKLRIPARARTTIEGLCSLGNVAGNHSRFLFDFSPESVVFRVSEDPAPRILYCFNSNARDVIGIPELLRKVRAGDIRASELIIGGPILERLSPDDRNVFDEAKTFAGVRAACEATCARIEAAS